MGVFISRLYHIRRAEAIGMHLYDADAMYATEMQDGDAEDELQHQQPYGGRSQMLSHGQVMSHPSQHYMSHQYDPTSQHQSMMSGYASPPLQPAPPAMYYPPTASLQPPPPPIAQTAVQRSRSQRKLNRQNTHHKSMTALHQPASALQSTDYTNTPGNGSEPTQHHHPAYHESSSPLTHTAYTTPTTTAAPGWHPPPLITNYSSNPIDQLPNTVNDSSTRETYHSPTAQHSRMPTFVYQPTLQTPQQQQQQQYSNNAWQPTAQQQMFYNQATPSISADETQNSSLVKRQSATTMLSTSQAGQFDYQQHMQQTPTSQQQYHLLHPTMQTPTLQQYPQQQPLGTVFEQATSQQHSPQPQHAMQQYFSNPAMYAQQYQQPPPLHLYQSDHRQQQQLQYNSPPSALSPTTNSSAGSNQTNDSSTILSPTSPLQMYTSHNSNPAGIQQSHLAPADHSTYNQTLQPPSQRQSYRQQNSYSSLRREAFGQPPPLNTTALHGGATEASVLPLNPPTNQQQQQQSFRPQPADLQQQSIVGGDSLTYFQDGVNIAAAMNEHGNQLQAMQTQPSNIANNRQSLPKDDKSKPSQHYRNNSLSDNDTNTGWRRGEMLGAGAYGRVYLGLNLVTGQLMAVKQVQLYTNRYANDQNTQSQQDAAIVSLQQEIEVMQTLQHSNIVAYLGTERTVHSFNIFLEYVPGGSISSLLRKFGKFNAVLVRLYTRQILSGLLYLHSHNIVHRDIKGGNILLDNNGICKLADFGAATQLTELAADDPVSLHGTVHWMAPEVIRQTGHGKAADIWSIGCTVLEMLSGKAPWSEFVSNVSAMYHIAHSDTMPTFPAVDILDGNGVNFLTHCFARQPQSRPSAALLLQHPWLTDPSIETATPTVDGSKCKSLDEWEVEHRAQVQRRMTKKDSTLTDSGLNATPSTNATTTPAVATADVTPTTDPTQPGGHPLLLHTVSTSSPPAVSSDASTPMNESNSALQQLTVNLPTPPVSEAVVVPSADANNKIHTDLPTATDSTSLRRQSTMLLSRRRRSSDKEDAPRTLAVLSSDSSHPVTSRSNRSSGNIHSLSASRKHTGTRQMPSVDMLGSGRSTIHRPSLLGPPSQKGSNNASNRHSASSRHSSTLSNPRSAVQADALFTALHELQQEQQQAAARSTLSRNRPLSVLKHTHSNSVDGVMHEEPVDADIDDDAAQAADGADVDAVMGFIQAKIRREADRYDTELHDADIGEKLREASTAGSRPQTAKFNPRRATFSYLASKVNSNPCSVDQTPDQPLRSLALPSHEHELIDALASEDKASSALQEQTDAIVMAADAVTG